VPDDTQDSPPELIRELSDACVRFVERAVGIRLDYTADTLPILDHYLQSAAGIERAEIMSLVAPAAGAYFGEVVRQQLGAKRWHIEDEHEGFRLEFEHIFLTFNPIGAALEAIWRREAEGFGANVAVLPESEGSVKDSLERMGDVRPDDYFRLAVRFEVIEQVAELLTEIAAHKNETHRRFGPEIYAAFRERSSAVTLH
jgi:hypothetical protein